jgi:hypothetical protein
MLRLLVLAGNLGGNAVRGGAHLARAITTSMFILVLLTLQALCASQSFDNARASSSRNRIVMFTIMAAYFSPRKTLCASPLSDDALIVPIRNRIAQLETASLDTADLKDVRDAVSAHTLAGHVDVALEATVVLLKRCYM